ncbi:hypothetical protein ACQY0O_000824 [Thecaphora frezii]
MLTTIYTCRHGFRMNWSGTELFLPTGRPRDPVLTAHGLDQARDLARFLALLPPDQQPQLIISSPYYRCLQTSEPAAALLDLELVAEPGLAEWFPPVPTDSGVHPAPARAATMRKFVPRLSLSWEPLLYPDSLGEDIPQLHARARRVLSLIQQRCHQLGVERVLLCSHAATLIALGRVLLQDDAGGQRTKAINVGTATLSKYTRIGTSKRWQQQLNGDGSFLKHGSERNWDFDHVPDNVTEPGMGAGWIDEEHPSQLPRATAVPSSKL